MADARVVRLAEVLVDHSTKVKKGEKVLIAGDAAAAPLIKEIYRKVLQRGAFPITQITLTEFPRIFYDEANDEQLENVEFSDMLYRYADVYIKIDADENKYGLSDIPPEKMQRRRKATKRLTEYLMAGGVRWVLTRYPTNAYAQDARMSLEQYEDFVYRATNVDYGEMRRSMAQAAELFNKAEKVRIVGKETDLTVDIAGRQAVLCSGEYNVPDGEFFFTPNHLLTEGAIYYDWPTSFGSREVQGIRILFRQGKIVEYSAEKGQDVLEEALNTDDGSRYLGELGIGMNFGIDRPTQDILFDEKIGGSVHLAVGRAYEEAGVGNDSAIHWDMVKNLKDGGEIYLDGKLVQKNGKWVF
ncbi:MAG TPA: aminopeptidase [Bacilli bacterium]